MKITRLIKVYEKLLPIYKKAYEEDLDMVPLIRNGIGSGLCFASIYHCGVGVHQLMSKWTNGYYKNYINSSGYLFRPPKTGKDLKTRIDFMESEIKSLKRLIKKGYTHV